MLHFIIEKENHIRILSSIFNLEMNSFNSSTLNFAYQYHLLLKSPEWFRIQLWITLYIPMYTILWQNTYFKRSHISSCNYTNNMFSLRRQQNKEDRKSFQDCVNIIRKNWKYYVFFILNDAYKGRFVFFHKTQKQISYRFEFRYKPRTVCFYTSRWSETKRYT